jgi:hypothetical protein
MGSRLLLFASIIEVAIAKYIGKRVCNGLVRTERRSSGI